ncbi:hypothetical protein UFOVP273_127 [uncultured Caudovirales phage]|uniref:Uncharacterized protein n=1 Tax=uncultured Caudovirales phage TaxID=2100421 RepID=A0A6J5LIR2_9CAUD|nr:hypothetical protein UFOVP273_127 [uncultured Caudovirales phage]
METLHTTESLRNMQMSHTSIGQADEQDDMDWFDSDDLPNHVYLIDGEGFFDRYVF